MHRYLKSIGFTNIQKHVQERELLELVKKTADERVQIQDEEDSDFLAYRRELSRGVGIWVCGSLCDRKFHQEYYFPYVYGDIVSTTESCMISRQTEKDAYIGSFDDSRFGATTIFYLSNPVEFRKRKLPVESLCPVERVHLCGLALSGRVLLPLEKTQEQSYLLKEERAKRLHLLQAAREGDEDAMDTLNSSEMNTLNVVNRRVFQEDLYSIVDTFFMPYGVECDQYMLMGEIRRIEEFVNTISSEPVYRIDVNCNNIDMQVVLTKESLLGVPKVGYRLKAQVWLQGNIRFRD